MNAMLVVFLGAAGAEAAAAQSAGAGGILDWIHKLSGPQFFGVGITAYGTLQGESGIRARLSVVHRWSIDEEEEVIPPESNITMWTLQPTLEFPLKDVPLELVVGVAFHRFQKDVDPFWHYSVPVLIQGRFPVNSSKSVLLRPGVGIHVFPAFGPNDFLPLNVDVSRDTAELVLQLFVGIDFRLTGLR
ncbi:MAG: hypothetical protein OEO20_15550 [Gemmatimonadota bacterium]|nr:hypothetical protein [Gemmatimonadota bacterium]MDH3479711.1 hypothetical protein [Gemmatimonadota bacterium]